jgi:hypothetical protein
MGRTTAYTLKNVTGVVNGQAVQGFWEGDDACSIEPIDAQGSMLIGADGDGIFSQFMHEAVRITLRLQHTSPTHRLLSQLMQRQRAQGNRLRGFPVSFVDADSNEGGATEQVFIETSPTDTKGKAATSRVWVLVTASWKPLVPNYQD